VAAKVIKIVYIATKLNLTDMLTKLQLGIERRRIADMVLH
jgi:hypothetical protein